MNVWFTVFAGHIISDMRTIATLAPAAGAGLAVPAYLAGALPASAVIILMTLAAVSALAHNVVTQIIRIRSSLANPIRAHKIDTRSDEQAPP